MISLTHLPEDVLFEVASYLSITDLLALRQTCRVLHAFGSSDYLWHRMTQRIGLPLDVPHSVPLNALSQDELQRTAIKAIRLEANWSRSSPHLRRATHLVRDTNGLYVDEMQFLPGGKWFLAAQRHRQMEGRWSSHVDFWSLHNLENTHRVASIEVDGLYRSSAIEVLGDGELASLVIGSNHETEAIEVYSVPLQEYIDSPYYATPTPTPSRRIPVFNHPHLPHLHPIIHQLALAHGVIAASVVIPGGNCSLQVLLANAKTGFMRWVNPQLLEPFSILWVRLHDGHIILIGMIRLSLVLRIYKIPPVLRSGSHCTPHPGEPDAGEDPFIDLGPLVAEYEEPLRRDSEFHDISRVSLPSSSSISVVVFYSFHDASSGVGQVTRFSLPFASGSGSPSSPRPSSNPGPSQTETPVITSTTKYFTMPAHASAQLSQVGPMGRAVWLEHNWETQQKRIMRYQPRAGATLGMLLPSDPALPFTPNICHSLAFDETTGRVCLGLFNGDVYVLDFV